MNRRTRANRIVQSSLQISVSALFLEDVNLGKGKGSGGVNNTNGLVIELLPKGNFYEQFLGERPLTTENTVLTSQ